MSETHTQVFLALSDPHRLKLFNLILEASRICDAEGADFSYRGNCISNLQKHLNLSQSTISHHIAILENANLVQSIRKGKWIHLFPVKTTLLGLLVVIEDMVGEVYEKNSAREQVEVEDLDSSEFAELISLISNHGAKVLHHNPLSTFFISFKKDLYSIKLSKSAIEVSLVSGGKNPEYMGEVIVLIKKYLPTVRK